MRGSSAMGIVVAWQWIEMKLKALWICFDMIDGVFSGDEQVCAAA